MIGSLRGKLIEKNAPDVLIEVNGVGYELSMPMSSFYNLPEIGGEVFVYTCFVVREDAQLLFGFTSREAKVLFKELIKVSGIGPKIALAILSSFNPGQFVNAVKNDSINSIVKVPGIGKKTAERLVIEIKDRVSSWKINDAGSIESSAGDPELPAEDTGVVIDSDVESQAVQALVALGYKPTQAASSVHKLYRDGMSVQDVIKVALKSI
ncbi:MAG: Holliday junction branch migration protein RuvA [Ruminobacter sp.]|uniref:Holliday junction branch migration protein RuvA n=1 Tax=Ruminobacter sp. TaxID=2774296 RepID=UPI00257FF90D|nr:Holliday junction branch migration protein RuvA [Ruminobacter sp.]MBQ3775890.1 Holliday junction branch migration protein RuvA [Ruminobacter sp.]